MSEAIKVTWEMALRPWWAKMWRSWLVLVAINVLLLLEANALGVALTFASFKTLIMLPGIKLVRLVVSLGVGYALAAFPFQRRYRNFTIEPRDNATDAPITLNYFQMLKIYWAITWRSWLVFLGMAIVIVILGFIVATVPPILGFHTLHYPLQTVKLAGLVIGIALFMPAMMYVIFRIYAALMTKRYSDFHLAIILHPHGSNHG